MDWLPLRIDVIHERPWAAISLACFHRIIVKRLTFLLIAKGQLRLGLDLRVLEPRELICPLHPISTLEVGCVLPSAVHLGDLNSTYANLRLARQPLRDFALLDRNLLARERIERSQLT